MCNKFDTAKFFSDSHVDVTDKGLLSAYNFVRRFQYAIK